MGNKIILLLCGGDKEKAQEKSFSKAGGIELNQSTYLELLNLFSVVKFKDN